METSTPTKVRVQQFIDQRPLSRRQRLIFFLTFLVVVADGMDLSIVSHIFPRLITEWGTTLPQVTATVLVGIVAMAVGALASGPAADRWGRKGVMLAGFLLFNLATAALGFVSTIEIFIGLRVLACIGLGIVLPVSMTLVADWAPAARRAQMVAIVFAGAAVGSILGAYLAATLIPAFGWQTMIVVAGLLPLLVVPFYARLVPEPPTNLVKRGRPSSEILRSLSVIAADTTTVDTTEATSLDLARRRLFAVVFSRALIVTTSLIWALTILGQALLILVLQYLPILLQQPTPGPGLNTTQSGLIVAMWGWGSLIGLVLVSFAMKWCDRFLTGVIGATLTIIGSLTIAVSGFDYLGLMIALLLTGMAFASLPSVVNAITTIAYPVEIRATGVGSASFAGRFGGMAGALIGGLLIAAGFGLQAIFAVLTIPMAITILGFLGLRADSRRRSRLSAAD